MSEQPKRLYRSQSNRMIAGVCGGIAEYLGVDPTAVRIAWVLLSILPLIPGIILYIIAWIVIPSNPTNESGSTKSSSISAGSVIGVVLIVVGGLLLLENLDIIDWWKWWRTFWEFAVPALLIAIGILILTRRTKVNPPAGTSQAADVQPVEPQEAKRPSLVRSARDRKLFGICGGLAEYFGIDASLIRIAFVFFSIWPFGLGAVLYLVLLLIMPLEPSPPVPSAGTRPQPSS